MYGVRLYPSVYRVIIELDDISIRYNNVFVCFKFVRCSVELVHKALRLKVWYPSDSRPLLYMRTQAFIVYDTFRQRSITSELMTESSVCWAWSRFRVRSFLLEVSKVSCWKCPESWGKIVDTVDQSSDFQSESRVELKWFHCPEHKGWRAGGPLTDIITQIHDAIP